MPLYRARRGAESRHAKMAPDRKMAFLERRRIRTSGRVLDQGSRGIRSKVGGVLFYADLPSICWLRKMKRKSMRFWSATKRLLATSVLAKCLKKRLRRRWPKNLGPKMGLTLTMNGFDRHRTGFFFAVMERSHMGGAARTTLFSSMSGC